MNPLMRGTMPAPGTFVSKADLEHGAYYIGECRNASMARWNAERQLFFHWRSKFGHRFVETIKAPEDELYWDVFVAREKLEKIDEEILFDLDA